MKLTVLLASGLLLATSVQPAPAGEKSIADAVRHDQRSADFKARDEFRHPEATLEFFEVRPDQTIVEIWPGGGGWYTEILAPLTRDKGKYYAAQFDADSDVEYYQRNLKAYKDKLAANPGVYDQVILTEFQPPKKLEVAPPGSADRVLTFRNVHNWMRNGEAATRDAFRAMYDALKPGGILGVVEHRLPEDMTQDPTAKSGYVKQSYVIKMAESAGFRLEDSSEINANPSDTADHPEGVWTLPPSLRLKDKDQDKYLAIGESDRMTLKFVKPEQEQQQ